MARFNFLGRAVDTYGNAKASVGIIIYLTGTTTPATVYITRTGGSGISTSPQITSDAYGRFNFYIDELDYPFIGNQKFDIVAAGLTYEDIEIMRGVKIHSSLEELEDDDHPQYASLSQNEIVTGKWLFSELVSGGITPTKDNHLTRKDYVDLEIANSSSTLSKSLSAASDEADQRHKEWADLSFTSERDQTNVQILSVSASSVEQDRRLQESINTTDHGELLGLVDDDHLQYLPVNASRQMSANWYLGTHNLGINSKENLEDHKLSVEEEFNDAGGSTQYISVSATGTHTALRKVYGQDIQVLSSANRNAHNSGLYGTKIRASANSGNMYRAVGGQFLADNYSISPDLVMYGAYCQVANRGTAKTGYGYSGIVLSDTVGTLTNGIGVLGQIYTTHANAEITTGKCFYAVGVQTAGTIGTNYLYYGTYSGTIGTKWGVYLENETKSYFSGDVGIGESSPEAKLDVSGDLILLSGAAINEFSIDGTLSGDSNNAVPTEKAVKTYVDLHITSVSAASDEADNRERETTNVQIISVSAASDEADQRHKEWADTMFASTSAASVEQDNRERETTNVQILSVSAASDEADNRLQNYVDSEISDINDTINNLSPNKITEDNSGVVVNDDGSSISTITISADGATVATITSAGIGIGSEPSYPLHIVSLPGDIDLHNIFIDSDPTGILTGNRSHRIINASIMSDVNRAGNNYSLEGINLVVQLDTGGDATSLKGASFNSTNTANASATAITGIEGSAINSGTASNIFALNFSGYHMGSGTLSQLYGARISGQNWGSGTVTTAYGIHSKLVQGSGVCETGYLYYGQYSGTWTTKWGLYLDGETKNYLSGSLGIGELTPQATLDVNGDLIILKGVAIDEFSNDITLEGNSPSAVPTEKAVKTYADNISAASREQDNRERETTNVQILSVSAASEEANNRFQEYTNDSIDTHILSVSAASDEADNRFQEYTNDSIDTHILSVSAASLERDNRERETTNIQIISVSAASREQDQRLTENIDTNTIQILSVSAASVEADKRVREYVDENAGGGEGYENKIIEGNSGVTVNDTGTGTINISADGDHLAQFKDKEIRLIPGADSSDRIYMGTPAQGTGGYFEIGPSATLSPSGTAPLQFNGYFYATKVYNAVWG